MAGDNPYEPVGQGNQNQASPGHENVTSSKAAYNVVSDTVTGLNVRKSDNKFQAIFIAIAVLVFAGMGAILALIYPTWRLPWFAGALIGGFAGLVIGFFASGTFLMIYRASRHLKGKHD